MRRYFGVFLQGLVPLGFCWGWWSAEDMDESEAEERRRLFIWRFRRARFLWKIGIGMSLWTLVLMPERVQGADEVPPRLEASFEKMVWREAPVLRIAAEDETGLKKTEITWREADGSYDSVSVELEGKSYLGTVALPVRTDGWPLTVSAVLYDENGNRMSWTGEVYLDRQPPNGMISLESGEGQGFYAKDQTVLVKVADDHMKAESLRGQVYRDGILQKEGAFFQKDGAWECSWRCEEEGQYQIVAEAQDQAGNSWKEEIAFVIDKTAPTITVYGYQEYYLETCEWEIGVTDLWLTEDLVNASLITPKGEEELLFQEGIIFWEGESAEDGWYEWKVFAADQAGNVAEQSGTFCIHREGSRFWLEGRELVEENQLPIVDENIWKFTDCGLVLLEQGTDYAIRETEAGRVYELSEEMGISYQIITKDSSGRRNQPEELLTVEQERGTGLNLEGEEGNEKGVVLVLTVFFLPFALAIKKGH